MPSDKARVRTYDAEIFVKQDNRGQVICCKALVYFFVPFNTHYAFDEGVYIVSGKMSMVDKDTPIGDEFNREDYLFQIDAIIFSPVPIEDRLPATPPLISISGFAGREISERRTFVLDISQYWMSSTRPVYHLCEFPMNTRFLNGGQVPYLNTPVTVLGCLYMGSLVVNAPDKRERICVEVKEVVFLKSESSSLSSLSSPSKGDLACYWGTPSKATAIASPSPTPSPKKGHNTKGKVKEGAIYDDVPTDVDEDGSDKELASLIERSKRKRSTYYA
ncbi:hypothetical protein BGW80DRAFT_1468518 [Lactifluus volemus]|nr:hypothetical protein BGW80DRAFT_1469565 [Lactifluus volemus]KAH9953505.1 hypothetical protein BGW80DRAFT_1468518 [Lactifluus volemus]